MPIRRTAATPTQEKTPSSAADKEPEASSEESPSADEEQAAPSAAPAEGEEDEAKGDAEPTENGEKADEGVSAEKEGEGDAKKEMKDGYKYEKSKAKKVKRTIPAWASVTANKNIPVTNYAGSQKKVDNILIEALTSFNDKSGVSFQSLMKYILKKYPGMELNKKKFLIKKAMKKHLEKGSIKQLKGKGLSGTFAMGKQPPQSKKAGQKQECLGDALPLIITRLCEPKEASYNLIKKYLEQHFPSFNIENRPDVLKTALVKAVEKGHLEQITGKGARGTFQLRRPGNKTLPKGGILEDAITVAITAMNEPKTCSTTSLRKYLIDANKDMRENQLVANLRRTLKKCKVLGWMEQITGHGFTGTYQLSFPFYPSPTILYPDKFKETPEKPPKRRKAADSSDEEESEEEESEEEESSEDEAPARRRKSQKRPPPKARRPPPTKRSRSSSQTKAKSKGRPLPKTPPAKKAAPPAKRSGRKQPAAAKKESAPAAKATPVKKGAPPSKPKTPAVKKLAKRGSRRPLTRETSPEETKGRSRRSESEESSPEEPPAKKPAAKGGSRRSAPVQSPAKQPQAKKQAKGRKQSARKSKRGKH